ncbi:MAG: ABC transporter permease [Candidatus Binatia bacterium]
MLQVVRNIVDYRELLAVLAWKSVVVRYKQAYLGLSWAVLKPLVLMLMFTLVRSIVGIESGDIPYPILTFAALVPWIFFQESTSDGVNSVVGHTNLIRKIYFPREIFPLTSVITKLVEFAVSGLILSGLMIYYGFSLTLQALWLPLIIFYTIMVSLCITFAGAAMNVYYRDVSALIPVALSLVMYASPIIYPLALVQDKLFIDEAAGRWSDLLYTLYSLNPMVGVIDAFQRALLRGLAPDFATIFPGMALTALVLPLSYAYFKRAEAYFADVI